MITNKHVKRKKKVMGLKIYEKEATQNKYMKAGKKIRLFWVMASCMLEQVCVRMSSAYVRS